MIMIQSIENHRTNWLEGSRFVAFTGQEDFVPHVDVFNRALQWMSTHGTSDSVMVHEEEFLCFTQYPSSF
jgi:hypothetical protein